jgi:predicted MFS family arabinose efflux permease
VNTVSASSLEASAAGRPGHPGGTGRLPLLVSVNVALLAASSAPTPLYATYATAWGLSPITTTVVFGVYAVAVLAALLVLGRLSDHLGRRPVLLCGLAAQVVTMEVLGTAGGVNALIVGRVLQGVATGAALGALGAAMLDVDRERGALANAVAPGIGTGSGALVSGLLVQFLPAPTHLVYACLAVVFVVLGVGVYLMPESVGRTPGARASLRPVLGLPRGLRGPVLAAAPILFAVWALAGFYGSLGPALVRHVVGSSSVVVGALGLFLLATVAAVTSFVLNRMSSKAVMPIGILMTLAAALVSLLAVEKSSALGLFVSTAAAGAGFGAGFQGGIRTVVPLAEPHQRAGVLSVLFVFCYLGMAAPSVAAGVEVVYGGGLSVAARDYSLFVIAMAVLALAGWSLIARVSTERED